MVVGEEGNEVIFVKYYVEVELGERDLLESYKASDYGVILPLGFFEIENQLTRRRD